MMNTSSSHFLFFPKKYIFYSALLLIFLIASFTRLFQIGNVPHGITNDEASYIYSSYSIWKTGHDLTGQFLPLSFNLGSSLSPVPVYLSAPFVGLLGVSPLSGRLPFVLLSIGTVIVLYYLTKDLFKNKWLGLTAAFVLSVSPWAIHLGRVAYDGVMALFFFTLATYLFLKFVEKGSILWSLPIFLLAFYSYHATKVFFIFYIPFLLILHKDILLKRKKELLMFLVGFFVILLSFFIVLNTQHVTRQQEVFFWNDAAGVTKQVDFELQKNTAPYPIRSVMNNKPLYYLRIIKENYMHAFSTDFLFLYGDTTGIYNSYFRGEMYTFESILLVLGAIYLFSLKNKKIVIFVFGSLLLSPLPSSVTEPTNYVVRSIMMLPFLSIIVGAGIIQTFQFISNRSALWKYILTLGVLGVYVLFVISFMYQYFFRYTVYGAENWFGSHRDIVGVINTQKTQYEKVFVSMPNKEFILQYAIFSKLDPHDTSSLWNNKAKTFSNITFTDECLPKQNTSQNIDERSLYVTKGDCDIKRNPQLTFTDPGEPLRITWRVFSE